MRHAAPHPPARIDPALEDPGLVERLLVDNGWTGVYVEIRPPSGD